jgi:hypothetical protein
MRLSFRQNLHQNYVGNYAKYSVVTVKAQLHSAHILCDKLAKKAIRDSFMSLAAYSAGESTD